MSGDATPWYWDQVIHCIEIELGLLGLMPPVNREAAAPILSVGASDRLVACLRHMSGASGKVVQGCSCCFRTAAVTLLQIGADDGRFE